VTIDNNILAGGSYALDVENTGHGSVTNVALTNNHLGSGLYGISDFNGASPSLSGNVNDAYTILPTLK
jgi:hypothetical protein